MQVVSVKVLRAVLCQHVDEHRAAAMRWKTSCWPSSSGHQALEIFKPYVY
jgi:hypothetical protein